MHAQLYNFSNTTDPFGSAWGPETIENKRIAPRGGRAAGPDDSQHHWLRDKSSYDQSFNVICHCKDGQIKIQTRFLIAAINFRNNLLFDNSDNDSFKVLIPDIERNMVDSILAVLYAGFASNLRNISSEVQAIFPDLETDITAADFQELTQTFHKLNEPSAMNDKTCSVCFQFFARKEPCLKHMQRMHTDK